MFDILPIHGELAPGESEHIHYSFYGHSDIVADVVAACKVEGGPTYELQMSGQASKVHYCFSNKALEFGAVLYDQVHSAEIVLFNRGRVTFDYAAVDVRGEVEGISPGEIAVTPSRGQIAASENVTLTVTFLPGVPESFKRLFEIEVAHFEPDVITLTGRAVYPAIALNLPRETSHVDEGVREEARARVEQRSEISESSEDVVLEGNRFRPDLLHIEMDNILMKKFVSENLDKLFNKPKPRLVEMQENNFCFSSMFMCSIGSICQSFVWTLAMWSTV